jgi:putative ABC transport system permease protein
VSFWETVRIALRALLRNKARSLLTMLGIVIGVAAVVAMVAIGEGAKARVQGAFASMGSSILVVSSGSTSAGGLRGGSGSMPTLTWEDLRAIQDELSAVRAAAPQLRAPTQVMSEEENWGTTVFGVTPDYFEIRNWDIEDGEPMNSWEVSAAANVAVLGRTVADSIFGAEESVVGRLIRIKNIPFTVVGLAEKKGQSASGHDYDDAVFIPVTTFASKIQGGLSQYLMGVIYVAAYSPEMTDDAEEQIETLLRERHHIRTVADEDFSIRNLTEVAAARQEGTRTMTLLLASIAAVSLAVGGIGIMNIMLVSVSERTREIGIRMAIGARSRSILAQFLTEALVLAALGGIAGVVLGAVVATRLADRFGWPLLLRPEIEVVSVVFSAAVGVVFGLYPASKASRMDPVEALRYE